MSRYDDKECASRYFPHWLYRAIDKEGATLDFYLADRRNAKAAKRFLAKALRRSRDWKLQVINTDKNPAYGEAIIELKKEGRPAAERHQHRQVKSFDCQIGPYTAFLLETSAWELDKRHINVSAS